MYLGKQLKTVISEDSGIQASAPAVREETLFIPENWSQAQETTASVVSEETTLVS